MENTNETYNGWTSWETWNANLWLTNDEGTLNYAKTAEDYHELKEIWEEILEGQDDIATDEINFKEIFQSL
jgi:hypothetical protein